MSRALVDPDSYDRQLGHAGTGTSFGTLRHEVTALVTNLYETDENGLPTRADRNFWTATLRSYGGLTQILKKTKGEMKDYLSNYNIVKQRMRSDPSWTILSL